MIRRLLARLTGSEQSKTAPESSSDAGGDEEDEDEEEVEEEWFEKMDPEKAGPDGDHYNEPPDGVDVEHYTAITDEVKQLKRDREHERALELLYWAMDETAAEVNDPNKFEERPAPWYFEHAAIIHRKDDQHDEEVAVLERYHELAGGRAKTKLTERLERARELAGENAEE